MASVTLLRLAGPVAGSVMLGAGMTGGLCAEPAGESGKSITTSAKPAGEPAKPAAEPPKPASAPASPCGNAVSILNEGKTFEAFDKLNGGGDRRLRFRLEGKEPCDAASDCKVSIVAKSVTDKTVATDKPAPAEKPATADGTALPGKATVSEKVIATVSLAGRTASYCVNGMSRVPGPPAARRDGCPGAYLVNFLAIKLVDGDGPFARRDISIQYLYRADAGAASLETCTSPAVFDGAFRRRLWTVALEDGAAAFIGEIDFPRDRRAPVPRDPPFAASVFGASE